VDDFGDVSRARATYELYADAMRKGRDILLRAGIAESPPPVPEFDAVFRRLDAGLRQALFTELHKVENPGTPDAMRIWQPLLKRAFAGRR
jgi:hypothetical protein